MREKYGDTKGKTVVNISTGERYKSCKLASMAIGIPYGKLMDRLNGRVKNKTPLRYLLNITQQ